MNIVDRKEYRGYQQLPIPIEGNTGKYKNYQDYLYKFISHVRPKRILEIGFNAGHSACCMLNACETASMYSFDICRYGTEQVACDVLKQYFDLTLIPGNSVETVPKFVSENKLMFDFVFVDGGHEYEVPYYDILNTKDIINDQGFMLIDDLGVGTVNECIYRSNILNEFESYKIVDLEKNILLLHKNVDQTKNIINGMSDELLCKLVKTKEL